MAETPAGWLPPRITGAVVVVTDWVVVGPVVVVVGLVVVGLAVVVVSSVVVGSVVVLEAVVVVEAAVVVGSVVVLGVVTGSWLVAPGVACVLVAVVSLQPGASAVASRPPVVIGRLADGLVSGLPVGGEGAVVGSVVVPVVKEVDVGASSAVVVGRATPGARCGDGAWGGNKVAEATRAARTTVLSPKATSNSLQGHCGLARCRGGGVGMCIVPVRQLLPGQGMPLKEAPLSGT
jgi:hypothetical protein